MTRDGSMMWLPFFVLANKNASCYTFDSGFFHKEGQYVNGTESFTHQT